MKTDCIMLIDDEPAFYQSAKAFLNMAGHKNVLVIKNGQSAVKLFSSAVDLVLMSIWLPDMDAAVLCRHFRHIQSTEHKPIIAVGPFSEELKPTCLEFGFDDYLRKPTSYKILTETLEVFLRKI